MAKRKKVMCPVCHEQVRLNGRGVITSHSIKTYNRHTGKYVDNSGTCTGSGKNLKEQS